MYDLIITAICIILGYLIFFNKLKDKSKDKKVLVKKDSNFIKKEEVGADSNLLQEQDKEELKQ